MIILLIASEVKYKKNHGKGIPSMLACRTCAACVAKVSDRKVSNHSDLKILSSKQMLQRLSIALEQVKAGNTSEK